MIEYRLEKLADIFDELQPLIKLQFEELERPLTPDHDLDPDWERYYYIEKLNLLKVITCREKGKLIGYAFFTVGGHLHSRHCLTAYEDVYFLKKEYRKGRIGIQLFKYAEEYMKSIGVNRIFYTTKVHSDNSRLFEYLGYTLIEKVYSKLI